MGLKSFSLEGRVALVTGGNKGLGLVMARSLAEAGARVAVTSREKQRAEEAAASIAEATGAKTLGLQAEVTDASQVEAMVQAVEDAFGQLDVLVNNAGVNARKPIEEYDEETWEKIVGTNLKGPYLCCKAVAPRMKKRQFGRIINVASILGQVALPGRVGYCASKGGVLMLTKTLALELAPSGVTVNALSPGPFATEMNKPVLENPETNKYFVDRLPLGRWGDPEEIGGAVVFLASDASSFMTGSELTIDGGWTAQ